MRPILMTITDRGGRTVWQAAYADTDIGRMMARCDRDATLAQHPREGLRVVVVNRDKAAPCNLDEG